MKIITYKCDWCGNIFNENDDWIKVKIIGYESIQEVCPKCKVSIQETLFENKNLNLSTKH